MQRLKGNSLFSGLPETEIAKLEEFIRIKDFPKNAVLIDEGVPGSYLYLLIAGNVKITRNGLDGREMILTERHAGDFFGEMALLDDAPRSARVVATEDSVAGVIGKNEFNAMMIREPRVAVNILRTISMRLRLSNDQIMQSMEEKERYHAKQLERFQSLIEFNKTLGAEREEVGLFRVVPVIVRSQILCHDVLLVLDDPESDKYHTSIQEVSGWRMIDFSETDKGTAKLAALKKTLTMEDFAAYEFRDTMEPQAFWKNAASIMIAPINGPRQNHGFIAVKSAQKFRWDAEDEAFMTTLASDVSMVLRNMRLMRKAMFDEKMSAVGKASSSLLHDFKNLLSVVYNYAKLIKTAATEEERKELVEKIVKFSSLMMGMSQEVLIYGDGSVKASPTPVRISEIFDMVMPLLDTAGKKITMQTSIPEGMEFPLDKDKICRVFYNILTNACDAMGDAGHISVTAAFEKNDLVIRISDTGPGIPEDVLPQIFKPFVTTKKHGTGLGLPIVKSIVEAHRGKVQIETRIGSGTTFIFTFPK
ncbi:MAG TPA: ATP-binding protein [bacterium]|nr:ATP-binding protein [bacterium]HMW35458.1 ATP-binding protein [bacterium]HMY35212.1 ATP-binding protein [bacterium]HMZ03216.1 ATP-binding protein [bacterium]HNB55387.1 ATP-binding protein [bacterium]